MSNIRMPVKDPLPSDEMSYLGKRKPTWIENTTEDRDSLHLCRLYPSTNTYGIPDLPLATPAIIPDALIAYREQNKPTPLLKNPAVHFYLDDYRFNSVWSKPWRSADAINDKRYTTILTPDFSLYTDMPDVLRQYNIYRNRWCGCFWHDAAKLNVIPSVSWLGPETWDYCFAGIPQGSVVAMNGIGSNPRGRPYELYKAGFLAMLDIIKPPAILSYGFMPAELKAMVPTHEYPTRWKQIKTKLKAQRDQDKARQAHHLLLASPKSDQGAMPVPTSSPAILTAQEV